MKSATTASTGSPPFDRCPSAPSRRNSSGARLDECVSQLQLRGHLADVAIGSHGQNDEASTSAGAASAIGRLGGGRRASRMRTPRALASGPAQDLADEGVQPVQISKLLLDRGAEPTFHSSGSRPPPGRSRSVQRSRPSPARDHARSRRRRESCRRIRVPPAPSSRLLAVDTATMPLGK